MRNLPRFLLVFWALCFAAADCGPAAGTFCAESQSRKLQCDSQHRVIQYTTKEGENFDNVVIKVIAQVENVETLWLQGVRFTDDRLSSRTLEKFTSLRQFVCNNCSLRSVDEKAFQVQSETLAHLELQGNRNLVDFGSQRLTVLRLFKVSGSKLSGFPAVNAPSLTDLSIDGSSAFQQLRGKDLSEYEILERLTLTGLKLRHIAKADTADLPQRVRRITITACGVETIESGAFASLPKLEALNLADNLVDQTAVSNAVFGTTLKRLIVTGSSRLSSLDNDALKAISQSVEEVDLSRCPLRTLAENLFKDMPKLRSVKLRSVGISTIGKNTFANCISLERLDLSNNTLQSNSWLPEFLPPSLTSLDLSDNEFMFAGAGSSVTSNHFPGSQLKILRLRNCRVSQIASLAFEKLLNLQEIDLSRNQLPELPAALCNGLAKGADILRVDLSAQQGDQPFRLPKTACRSLETVTTLKLADLQISTATLLETSEFWRSLPKLTDLDLSGNRLAELLAPTSSQPTISNLQTFLAYFTATSLLQQLTIERSMLSGSVNLTAVCVALPNLRTLKLNSNGLTGVVSSNASPQSCANLLELGLSSNAFSTLEKESIKLLCAVPRLTVIELHSNPWTCTCDLIGFWNAAVQQRYAIGSQQWCLIKSTAKNSFKPQCSQTDFTVDLIGLRKADCDLPNNVAEWQTCVSRKKQLALATVSKQRLSSSESSELPDYLMFSDADAMEEQSTENSDSSHTGLFVAGGVLLTAVVAGVGIVLFKRRQRRPRFRRPSNNCFRGDIALQSVSQSPNSSFEALPTENETSSLPERALVDSDKLKDSEPKAVVVQPSFSASKSCSSSPLRLTSTSSQPGGRAPSVPASPTVAPQQARNLVEIDLYDKNDDNVIDELAWDAEFNKLA